MSIYLRMTTDGAGLIPSGRDLYASATGGGTLGSGTPTAVAAGDLTTSGNGTGVALSIQNVGGIIFSLTTTAVGNDYKVGDTITVPVSASGGAGESTWTAPIVITLTAANIDEGQATVNVPLDDYGCTDPQSASTNSVEIDLLQPGTDAGGINPNRFRITFNGITSSNEQLTAAAVSAACRDAITSTSDVFLNPYLPEGVTPAQVVLELN